MKKRIAFCLILLLAVLVSACGGQRQQDSPGEITPEDLRAAAVEKLAAIKSYNAEMRSEIKMKYNGADLTAIALSNITAFADPAKFKVTVDINTGTDPEATKIQSLLYGEKAADGSYTLYSNDGSQWTKKTLAGGDAAVYDDMNVMATFLDHMSIAAVTTGTTANGEESYRLEGVIPSGSIAKILGDTSALSGLNSQATALLSALLMGNEDLPLTLWIGKESGYPLQYEADLSGFITTAMKSLAATGNSGAFPYEVKSYTVTGTMSHFNAAADFTIPAEAKQ